MVRSLPTTCSNRCLLFEAHQEGQREQEVDFFGTRGRGDLVLTHLASGSPTALLRTTRSAVHHLRSLSDLTTDPY